MNQQITTIVEAQRQQFLTVLADKSIEFDREAAFAVQILNGNDYLCKVALNNQDSLRAAVTNVAAIGISLNPASKLAYLVPRKGGVCLDISYMGLMHIAQQTGAIKWGQAVIVRANDTFELRGMDSLPLHTYKPFATNTERGDIVGVYVVVKTEDGDYLTHTMEIHAVTAIRDRSEAWKAFVKDNTKKCPWNTDEQEMIKKTCVKQAAKYWPRRDRLDSAVNHLNTDGGEGVAIEQNKMPEDEITKWVEAIEKTTTHEAAKAAYAEAVDVCRELKDKSAADRLKAITIAHREFIESTVEQVKEAA